MRNQTSENVAARSEWWVWASQQLVTFCWSSPRKETIERILQQVLEYLVYMTGMVREGMGKRQRVLILESDVIKPQ